MSKIKEAGSNENRSNSNSQQLGSPEIPPPLGWQKRLPMQLTLSRIFIVPLIIVCLGQPTLIYQLIAVILIIGASITDYYDGYFARKYKTTSTMGKFMDPIADKILVSSILIFLLSHNKLDPYMVMILIARDTLIGGIRSVAAADSVVIDAKPAGKWKTAIQMIAIPAVIFNFESIGLESSLIFQWIQKVGYYVLWMSTILSLTSGWEYYRSYQESRKKLNTP